MKYKIERFQDIAHLNACDEKNSASRPYTINEREFPNTDMLVKHLELEREGAKESGLYRITPMGDAFVVEVDVDILVNSHVGSTS